MDGIRHITSWVNPNGNANFPMVNSDGDLYLLWADNDQDDNWRWLVAATCVHSPLNDKRGLL